LADVFNFVDVKIAKIAKHLNSILESGKFMDNEPFDKEKRKQSTFLRWQEQTALMPSCKFIKKIGSVSVVYQWVKADGKRDRDVNCVHIVSTKDFEWADTPENIPPTCCCHVNRNAKDVCCGIMVALQNDERSIY
jgi:hypothetical protein